MALKPPILSQGRHLVFLAAVLLWVGCQDAGPQRLIDKANDEWVKGRNQSAAETFKTVLEMEPTGPYAEEALFRLGEIYYFDFNDHGQALNYFQEVARQSPKSPFTYDAQKYIAEIVEINLKDLDQAIIEYQNLINHYPKKEQNAEHQFRIASIFFKKQNYDQALVELKILLENYPGTDWAEQAYYRTAEILYSLQRCPEARVCYGGFKKQFPNSGYIGDMDFIMASCLEEEGQLQLAYNRFKELEGTYKYPAILKMKMEGIQKRIQKGGRTKRKIPRSQRRK